MDLDEGATELETADAAPVDAPSPAPESQPPAAAPAGESDAGHEAAQPVEQVEPPAQAALAQPAGQRRPNRAERRNADLSRRLREAHERIAILEGRFAERYPPQTQAAREDPKPDADNFPGGAFGEPYVEALIEWKARQLLQQHESERATREMQSRQEQQRQAEIEAGAKRYKETRRLCQANGMADADDFLAEMAESGAYDFIDDITETDYALSVAAFLAHYEHERGPQGFPSAREIMAMNSRQRVRWLDRIDGYIHDHAQKRGAQAQPGRQPSGQPPAQATPAPTPQPDPAPIPVGKGAKLNGGGGGSALDELYS